MRNQSYNEAEEQLLSHIRQAINGGPDAEAAEIFTSMELNIRRLSEVFQGYPSILDPRGSGADRQSTRTLMETLFHGGIDHSVLLPTKVSIGRSFMIAKFNLFGYLRKLCEYNEGLEEFRDDLQTHWEAVIFSLLLEDVYQVIIERTDYGLDIRRHAAMDLMHLWEHRFDENVTEYAPTLTALWSVRRRLVPVFGTMLGTMELIRLSSLLPDRWYDFLDRHGDREEVQEALEEFIFGLAFEDLCRVRDDMRRRNISVIDRQDMGKIPGVDFTADDVTKVDPREMYRFYQDRTKRADGRKVSGQPGPIRTLEELLLVHMIEARRAAGSTW